MCAYSIIYIYIYLCVSCVCIFRDVFPCEIGRLVDGHETSDDPMSSTEGRVDDVRTADKNSAPMTGPVPDSFHIPCGLGGVRAKATGLRGEAVSD